MCRTIPVALMLLALSSSSPAASLDVRERGAVGDGKAVDTRAIQAALDACAGGGRVVVPPGTYLCGRVVIPSNVTVHLEAGATVQGSDRPEDYAGGAAVVFYARDAERIAIVGRGTIRGLGEADLGRRPDTNDKDNWPEFRAGILRMENCRDVTLRDFRILFSDTWTLRLDRCDNVVIDGLAIRNNYFRTNSDGIDPVSCRNVHISNCHIVAGDDCIVMKTRDGEACEDIVVTNCTLESIATAIKLGTESMGDFRNIRVSNCTIRNSTVGIGIYLKDGGTMERIAFQNMTIENYEPVGETNVEHGMYPIFVDIERRHEDSKVGRIRDLTFDTIDIASGCGILIQGMPESLIEGLALQGISLRVTKPIDYSDRKKHVGGRRTTRDERDTLFARKPSYATVAYVDGLSVDGLRVSMTNGALMQYERAAFSGYFVNNYAVRDVARAPHVQTAEVPVVVLRDCGRGSVSE
jgi:polygalacturonase